MKKYCLVETDKGSEGEKLYQIKVLREFTTINETVVKVGDLGGFVSGEYNLSHEGNCWVANSAEVREQACVSGNAYVGGIAVLYGNVQVFDNASMRRGHFFDSVKIYGNADVSVKEDVWGEVEIFDNAAVCGKNIKLRGNVKIFGNAKIHGGVGEIVIEDHAKIYGNARIEQSCHIKDDAEIGGEAIIRGSHIKIEDRAKIFGAEISGASHFRDEAQIIGNNIFIGGGVYFEEQAKVINTDPTQKIEISGNLRIGGKALIQSQNDFLQGNIFSDFGEKIIAYRTENGFEIRQNNRSFSPEQVKKALNAYAEYEKAIQLAKSRVLGAF